MGLKKRWKELKKSTENLYKAGLDFNAKDTKDAGRTLITTLQKGDPGSHAGFSGVPGVESQRDIKKAGKIEEARLTEFARQSSADAATQAAIDEANEELLTSSRSRKGRGSTMLTGGQGLTGSSNVYRRTLLGA